MHIAIDCRSVHRRMGGIGRAALELVRGINAASHDHRITVIAGAGHETTFPEGKIVLREVEAAMIDERFEQLHLPSLLREIGVDLYLNTTFSVPAVKTTRRQLSIIHDVVFEDEPDFVESRLRSYLSRWSRFAACHADHVLTVSDHAKGRIQSVYGLDPSRVTRVYNGVASDCFESPGERNTSRVIEKFGQHRPFILYLGTIETKKGIPNLLRAFKQASESGLSEDLVLAGGKGGPGFDLDSEIRKAGCAGRVRYLGFVDEGDKKALLKACSLFVYPSLYEGFGLPPLEAMALGTPCVVGDGTSLPEIAGDAALVTGVQKPDQLCSALVRGIRDNDFRHSAARRGPLRARQFTWARAATEVLAVCERVGAN